MNKKQYIKKSYIDLKRIIDSKDLSEYESNILKSRIVELINNLKNLEKNYLFKLIYKEKLLGLYIELEFFNNGKE